MAHESEFPLFQSETINNICLSPLLASLAIIWLVRGPQFIGGESAGMFLGGLPTTGSHFSDAASREAGRKTGGVCTLQLCLEWQKYRGSSEVMSGVFLQRVTLGSVTPARSTHPQTTVFGKGQDKNKHSNATHLHQASGWEDRMKQKCFCLN